MEYEFTNVCLLSRESKHLMQNLSIIIRFYFMKPKAS